LNKKQRVFVEYYLRDWNATKAARLAGYAHPNVQATRLLANIGISEEIQRRLDEIIMETDEIQRRYSDIARADISDFMDIERMTFSLNLHKAKELGLTHLIKKVKQRTRYIKPGTDDEEMEVYTEIELHGSLEALRDIAKMRKLFSEKGINVNVNVFDPKEFEEVANKQLTDIDNIEEEV
jgi:phage terminase small subunit